jgi:hypothetical protein
MKRREIFLAIVGAAALILGARWVRHGELPKHEVRLDETGCRLPVTIIEPPPDVQPAGSVIMIHGLSSNRRLMTYLGEDFAGHGLRFLWTCQGTATTLTHLPSGARSSVPPLAWTCW